MTDAYQLGYEQGRVDQREADQRAAIRPALIFDGPFEYPGFTGSRNYGRCRLRVWREPGMNRLLMLATERADNPGPSITNVAANLWTAAWRQFMPGFHHPPLCFEHYGAESYDGGRDRAENVDQVECVGFLAGAEGQQVVEHLAWVPCTVAFFNRLVGTAAVDPARERDLAAEED